MKAQILGLAIMAGFFLTAGVASANQTADEKVSIRNVKLLDEQIVNNGTEKTNSNNWERRERWERHGWERRREGWWERR